MKTEYSPSEQHVMAYLPDNTPVTTGDLAMSLYGEAPKIGHPRQAVTFILRSLQKKIKANREKFDLINSPHNGPHDTTWMLKR